MDKIVTEMANQYDVLQTTGQNYITKSWKYFTTSTRRKFCATECYDKYGKRLINQDAELEIQSTVENLEYQIGILKQCDEVRLPNRTDKGYVIPNEATSDDVLSACNEILYYREWFDPVLIRLALRAVVVNQKARLLMVLPRQKEGGFLTNSILKVILAIFSMLLILGSPSMVATALTSAANNDVSGATGALYLLGFTVWIYTIVKGISGDKNDRLSKEEGAYNAWDKLSYVSTGYWLGNGIGAKFYLEQISNDGVSVPLVAFDLCGVLEKTLDKQEAV